MRCEDFPCCGHGPAPLGDGGGCPDDDGYFDCVECGDALPRGASSSICSACCEALAFRSYEDDVYFDGEEATRELYDYDSGYGGY